MPVGKLRMSEVGIGFEPNFGHTLQLTAII
jgi:hypothetical protein